MQHPFFFQVTYWQHTATRKTTGSDSATTEPTSADAPHMHLHCNQPARKSTDGQPMRRKPQACRPRRGGGSCSDQRGNRTSGRLYRQRDGSRGEASPKITLGQRRVPMPSRNRDRRVLGALQPISNPHVAQKRERQGAYVIQNQPNSPLSVRCDPTHSIAVCLNADRAWAA